MTHHAVQSGREDAMSAPPFWRSRYAVGLVVLGAIAAYFLLSEHRAHFFGALPFLLLLACPFMHMFMHGGHSGHGSRHGGVHGVHADQQPGAVRPGTKPAPEAGAPQ